MGNTFRNNLIGAVARHDLIQTSFPAISYVVAYLPIPLTVGAYVVKHEALWAWIAFLLVIPILSTWLGSLLRIRNFVLKTLTVSSVCLTICTGFAVNYSRASFLATVVFCGIFVVLLSVMGMNGDRLRDSGLLLIRWAIGLIIQFAAFFWFPHVSVLRADVWMICISSPLTLVLVLFNSNELSLYELLSADQTHVPGKVRRFNQFLVTMFLGLLLLIFAALKLFVNWTSVERRVVHFVDQLLGHSQNHGLSSRSELQHVFPDHPHQQLPKPTKPPNAGWSHTVGIILMIGMMIACLYLLAILIRKLWRWYLSQRETDSNDLVNYVDEEESILSEKHRFRWSRRRKVSREALWEDQSSANAKVRYLYRHFVRENKSQGYTWEAADTARETVERIEAWCMQGKDDKRESVESGQSLNDSSNNGESLTSLYDKARYSTDVISEEQIHRLYSGRTNDNGLRKIMRRYKRTIRVRK